MLMIIIYLKVCNYFGYHYIYIKQFKQAFFSVSSQLLTCEKDHNEQRLNHTSLDAPATREENGTAIITG